MAHPPLEAVSIDKLESLLQCSICLETVRDPRTLPCFHSFCKTCLEDFVIGDREKVGRQIKDFGCPNCRRQFTLNPGEEVADMTPNHFICNMLDVMAVQNRVKVVSCSHCQGHSVGRCVTCEVFLCQECLAGHNNYRGFAEHSVLSMAELSKPENQSKIRRKLHCQVHQKKTLKFYCETCEELICRDCTDFNHEKPEHSWLPFEKVAGKQKQLLDESCTALENKLQEGNQALGNVTDVTQSLAKVKERIKVDINARKDTILDAVTRDLNEKAEDLINQVDRIYTRKHNSLAKQVVELEGYVEKLKSCVDLSREILTKGTDEEILSSVKMMKKNFETVQKGIPNTMKPSNDDGIYYECGPIDKKVVKRVCAEMGKVGDSWDPISTTNANIGDRACHVTTRSVDAAGNESSECRPPRKKQKHCNDELDVRDELAHTIDPSRCQVCLNEMENLKAPGKCGHTFCATCFYNAFMLQRVFVCPICVEVYGQLTGNQPPGQMSINRLSSSLPGYENCGTIMIHYHFDGGTQGPNHPKPGLPYTGTTRRAYLPNNDEGRKVLNLLEKAFDQNLTFTIGQSPGAENVVIWDDIPHKTSTTGGQSNCGYPDPTYLATVQEKLAAKGIKE